MTRFRDPDVCRYYYAVATFSNASAAARVLSECNGTEFEHTANIMDLSYVPDEMDFDGDEVRQVDCVPDLFLFSHK
jgi:hypothetical protein